MKAQFRKQSNKGGIYQIRNLQNGKVYIGSAKSFKKRYYQHKHHLRMNKHGNPHLQRAWNKGGEDVFQFEILEVVSGNRNARIMIEQVYLDKYQSDWTLCYNILKKAATNSRTNWSQNKDYKHTEETKKRIGSSNKGKSAWNKGKKRREETKKKISEATKGRVFSDEHRRKLRLAKKGKPPSDGTLANLRKMAKENKGKARSEETKRRISETKRRRK